MQPWSAETPYLYGLLIELEDESGNTAEAVHHQIGFRHVAVEDGRVVERSVTRRCSNGIQTTNESG